METHTQIDVVMRVLRDLFRTRGIRHTDIASHFDISPRTVARWFKNESVPADVIEKLSGMLNLSFFDVCELAAKKNEGRFSVLSIAQEQLLVDEPLLNYLFTGYLRRWSSARLQHEIGIPDSMFVDALVKLDKAGLIELLPYNDVKLLTTHDIRWRANGPYTKYQQMFLEWCVREASLSEAQAYWIAESIKLSPASKELLRRRYDELREQAIALADEDRRSNTEREWNVVVLGFREKPFTGEDFPSMPRKTK